MESKHICNVCGKSITEFNHIGLNKKLLGRSIEKFFCMDCLANFLEVTAQTLEEKIDDFIAQDCALFVKREEIPYGREVWEQIKHKFEGCGENLYQRALTAFNKINEPKYKKILCSISGGADSDIMLDWIHAMDYDKKVEYVFFDTGLEYKATKRHLESTERKYGIKIKHIKAAKPIPLSCKQYGVPFLHKEASMFLERLQRHNFQWEDEDFETLYKRYPKSKSALLWWCNKKHKGFGININKGLKEFIIANPPNFKISSACCNYAKKAPAQKELKNGYDLQTLGLRRGEAGIRATIYKNCFTNNEKKSYDDLRPLFFITDKDKILYKTVNNITYSDCYEVWGFGRTGCAGCPFNSRFEKDLRTLEKYEPDLYKVCQNIFGKSYEYTRKYREFKENYIEKGNKTTDLS